ncbi:hypothetical protein MG1_05191 [Candida albicans GC75]|nr:hypothetical protein MG1_05191 [Candida albicans GC75]
MNKTISLLYSLLILIIQVGAARKDAQTTPIIVAPEAKTTTTTSSSLSSSTTTTTGKPNNGKKSPGKPTTDSNDIVQITLQRPTTPPLLSQETQLKGSGDTKAGQAISGSTTTSVPSSIIYENNEDKSLFKVLFTIPPNDIFYNADFNFGNNDTNNDIQLRLDLIQPEIWVLNKYNFPPCEDFLANTNSPTTTKTTPSTFTSTMDYNYVLSCASYGAYTSSSNPEDMESPTPGVNVQNYQPYIIPYLNSLEASGEFVTDDISFNLTTGDPIEFKNMTFLDVNDSNALVGGLGLAGTPKGSGFLYSLVDQGIIESPGYSLWFSNDSNPDTAIAQLLPGVINQKYYVGNFYQFDMIPHTGFRYNASYQEQNQDLFNLILPVIQISDILMVNLNSGQKLTMKSNDDQIPVLLDSRASNFYLPLEVIINLAIQTRAYYSSELTRWLVTCHPLLDVKAAIEIQIGGLTVSVPISKFIDRAVYNGSSLNFENGAEACVLKVVPSSVTGYNMLGLPFLKQIYLAVDNEGKKIALANSNKYLKMTKQDIFNDVANPDQHVYNNTAGELADITNSNSSSSDTTSSIESGNSGISGNSIDYIKSGKIPFATVYSESTEGTFIYSSLSQTSGATVILDIPARFSGASIKSGLIYLNGDSSTSVTTSAINSTSTSKAQANLNGQMNYVEVGTMKFPTAILSLVLSIFLIIITLL